jgi:hypothetical protein
MRRRNEEIRGRRGKGEEKGKGKGRRRRRRRGRRGVAKVFVGKNPTRVPLALEHLQATVEQFCVHNGVHFRKFHSPFYMPKIQTFVFMKLTHIFCKIMQFVTII